MYVPKALILCLLLAACQPKPSPQQPSDGLDTVLTDTVLTDTPARAAIMPPEDPSGLQLLAQDTLFEDGSKPANWDDAGFTDPAGFKRFVARFKEWVRADQVDSIAASIRYPLGKYKTAAQFKQHYAQVFDRELKEIVASQRLDRIFRNYQGAMLGNGAIWFTQTDQSGYRIIAINK
ncbi:hypothetical protein F0L74_19660 [Chitinophaga agrisoli]|uniref:Uncharacterized protein n=1 Tax=Chitinophaga agrisoli TaxID=2607653 RepID=A0A5B2VJR5_9BACT|nr:hypothetical protein [Chitinophaga agrisoli]KAA2238447.1 hypothetical protein F0L74_19660 [Chitinophaga agrisoli]